jgi:hypothetical protein
VKITGIIVGLLGTITKEEKISSRSGRRSGSESKESIQQNEIKQSVDKIKIDLTIVIVVGCRYDSGFISDLDVDLFAIPPIKSER